MDKVFILVTGEKMQAFTSLRRLLKTAGIEPNALKRESLPFKSGRLMILELDVDTRL